MKLSGLKPGVSIRLPGLKSPGFSAKEDKSSHVVDNRVTIVYTLR
jgi:hypothetical protein